MTYLDSAKILKQWRARESKNQPENLCKDDYQLQILTESGKLFTIAAVEKCNKEQIVRTRCIPYPQLPGARLVEQAVIDDQKIVLVTKDKKLFYLTAQSSQELKFFDNFTEPLKLSDGTYVKEVNYVEVHQKNNGYKTTEALLLSCLNSNEQGVLCSNQGHSSTQFNIISSQNSTEKFVKVSAQQELVMAIDEDGEIWVFNAQQKQLTVHQPNNQNKANDATFLVKTNIMAKQNAKALDIIIKKNLAIIKSKANENGNEFFFSIQFSEDCKSKKFSKIIEINFDRNISQNIEVIQLTDCSFLEYQSLCLILRKRKKSELKVWHKPIIPILLPKEEELNPRVYSDEAQQTFQRITQNATLKGKLQFLEQKFQEKEIKVSREVYNEMEELRKNHQQIFHFLLGILPLVQSVVVDVYGMQSSKIPDFNKLTKTDPNVSQRFVSLFKSALNEFSNDFIINRLLKKAIDFLKTNDNEQDISKPIEIDQVKAKQFYRKGRSEKPNENETVFSQMATQYDQVNFKNISDPPFYVEMIGFNAIDGGGPMREIISDICYELMQQKLSFWIPTQNEDHFTLNPLAESYYELQKIFLFGKMLGWSIINQQSLALELAPHIWKRIAQGSQVKMTIQDLKKVDESRAKDLQNLKNSTDLSEKEFEALYQDYFFEVELPIGRIQLCDKGSEIKLTKSNLDLYIDLYIEKYFQQDIEQFRALYQGVEDVCGRLVLTILNEKLAETRACSSSRINCKDMERAIYFDCPKSIKQMFVWCLKKLKNSGRKQLLRFISGNSRVIPNTLYTVAVKDGYDKVDQQLPESGTCFTTLKLPHYSTKEIMLERIRTAFQCQDIDGDGDGADRLFIQEETQNEQELVQQPVKADSDTSSENDSEESKQYDSVLNAGRINLQESNLLFEGQFGGNQHLNVFATLRQNPRRQLANNFQSQEISSLAEASTKQELFESSDEEEAKNEEALENQSTNGANKFEGGSCYCSECSQIKCKQQIF